MDNRKLWESILGTIELQVSKGNFVTWFRDTHIHRIDEGTVYLAVPSAFAKDWISSKFHKTILKYLRDFGAGNDIRSIEYVISKTPERKEPITEETVRKQFLAPELPLQEFYISREDNLNPRYTFETLTNLPTQLHKRS